LKNKLTDLQFLLISELLDIVCVTETWLTSDFFNCSLATDLLYSVYQSDRHNVQGGGVCILTRDESIKSFSSVFINSEAFAFVMLPFLSPSVLVITI